MFNLSSPSIVIQQGQLQRGKQLLMEKCGSILWEGEVECDCGCMGYLGVVQWSDCSIHNYLDCDCCKDNPPLTKGMGGTRADQGPTMG